ncbi:DUF4942 domain-containing protein [Pantoea cypripedii]|uniref:DUF4942 domain-containing protein n=1 Tax=Pantoea cypripedii TaxID=55209 RepID=UPI002FC61819
MKTSTQIKPFTPGLHGSTDMIPSAPVEQILAQRSEGLENFAQGMALLAQARRHLTAAAGEESLYGFTQCVTDALPNDTHTEKNAAAIRRLADRKIWDRLMSETGMYTFMSSKQREEWDRQLNSNEVPEITLDNVLATFRELNEQKENTFETGVIDVFRSLSWDYKTNHPCRLGKKIIINNFIRLWGKSSYSLTQSGQQKLDDLARPFYVMDNKPVPDFRLSEGVVFSDFFNRNGQDEIFESEYYSVRWFKKGTAHIVFKRMELVERINDMVAKHYPGMLPPKV